VNLLLKQFKEMQRMIKGMPGLAMRKQKKNKKGGRTTPKKRP
jgi:signal recognition particle GTPase